MNRRVAGHAHTPRDEPRRRWWRLWWGRLIAVVAAVGVIAGTIGSVRALWPEPDVMDSARFNPAPTVIAPLALGDFQEREAVLTPVPAGSAAFDIGRRSGPATLRVRPLAMTGSVSSTESTEPTSTRDVEPGPGDSADNVSSAAVTGTGTGSQPAAPSASTSSTGSTQSTQTTRPTESATSQNTTEASISDTETQPLTPPVPAENGFAQWSIPVQDTSAANAAGNLVMEYVPLDHVEGVIAPTEEVLLGRPDHPDLALVTL